MIPVTTLYDISIGQNCLKKKNPLGYIVPTPSRGVGKIIKRSAVGDSSFTYDVPNPFILNIGKIRVYVVVGH